MASIMLLSLYTFRNYYKYKLQIVYLLYNIHTVSKEYKIILLKHDAKLF